MDFITEIFGQIVILLISGTIFSFVVWKLKRRKTDFGEFLYKYGEMLAYGGLLFHRSCYWTYSMVNQLMTKNKKEENKKKMLTI